MPLVTKKTLLICASPKVSPLVEVFRKYYGKSAPKSRVIISEYRLMLYHMQNHCKYFIRNLCCLSQTFLSPGGVARLLRLMVYRCRTPSMQHALKTCHTLRPCLIIWTFRLPNVPASSARSCQEPI